MSNGKRYCTWTFLYFLKAIFQGVDYNGKPPVGKVAHCDGLPSGLLLQPRAANRLRTAFLFCQVSSRFNGQGWTEPNRGFVTAFKVT